MIHDPSSSFKLPTHPHGENFLTSLSGTSLKNSVIAFLWFCNNELHRQNNDPRAQWYQGVHRTRLSPCYKKRLRDFAFLIIHIYVKKCQTLQMDRWNFKANKRGSWVNERWNWVKPEPITCNVRHRRMNEGPPYTEGKKKKTKTRGKKYTLR